MFNSTNNNQEDLNKSCINLGIPDEHQELSDFTFLDANNKYLQTHTEKTLEDNLLIPFSFISDNYDDRDITRAQNTLPWINESGKICYAEEKEVLLEQSMKSLSIQEKVNKDTQTKVKFFHPYENFTNLNCCSSVSTFLSLF